jgi:hypothetical protein
MCVRDLLMSDLPQFCITNSNILKYANIWSVGFFIFAVETVKIVVLCVSIQYNYVGARGGVVVKALRYKPEGRGFDFRWCHWNSSVT